MCGGAQKILTFVANQLSALGEDVTILSYASKKPNFDIAKNVNYISGEDYKYKGVFKHIAKISTINDAIKKSNPSIIIAFAPIPAILSIFATIGNKTPVVFCERGDPSRFKSLVYRIKFYPLRFSNWHVFQTENAKALYSKRVQKNSSVIPNPITFEFKKAPLFNERNNEIAFVGRFDIVQKRQDLMLLAFSELIKYYPNIKLVFYGEGDDMESIKKLASSLDLNEKVAFAGKVNNIEEKIRFSRMFVLTSDFEGIPNALIEAMSVGLPCVSTDCSPGGARLLIKNKINGLLVPPNDCESLVSAMRYMLDNPTKSQRMGECAQNIYKDYSSDKIAGLWKNMIYKVCEVEIDA